MQAQPFIARLQRDLSCRREFRGGGWRVFGSLVECVGGQCNLRAVEFTLKIAELLPAEPQAFAYSPLADAFERLLQRGDRFRIGEWWQAVSAESKLFITRSLVR